MTSHGWQLDLSGPAPVARSLVSLLLLTLLTGCSSSPPPALTADLPDPDVHHCWDGSSSEHRVVPPFERIWGKKTGGRLVEGMTVAEGRLYVASYNRRCASHDYETGRRLWRTKLPDQPLGAPELGGGRIWIVVGPRSPQLLSFDAVTGNRVGQWPIPTAVASPIFADSLLIVSTLQGKIMALRWERLGDQTSPDLLPLAWGQQVKGGLRTRPLVLADSLLLVGSLADSLHAFDMETGDPVWALGVGSPVYGLTPSEDGGVVVTLYDGTALTVDSSGLVRWSESTEGPLLLPAAAGDGLVVTVSAGGIVTALDPERGVRWTANLQQAVAAPPVLTRDYVIVSTRRGSIVGFQLQKGTRDWSLDFQGPMTVSPCVSAERILVADGRGEIRAFTHAGATRGGPLARSDDADDVIPRMATTEADTAWISVSSEPSGLGVLLDGRFAGWTPLDSLRTSPGLHRVGLRDSSGLMAGEARVQEWVRLEAGDHRWLILSSNENIELESVPPGATVTLGSEYLGTAPLLIPREPGSLVRVRHPGFRDTVLAVEDIQSSRILVRMRPDGRELASRLPASGVKKPWYTRDWVRWGAPLLTLASGAAAVLLRQEANNAYDDYLRTGENRARDEHLARAERLDRQSAVSWVAAEVFFGFAFYSWIRSDQEKEKSSDIPRPAARRERDYP